MASQSPMRALPSVDAVLARAVAEGLLESYSRAAVVDAVRELLAEKRHALRAQPTASVTLDQIVADLAARLRAVDQPRLRRVINATGVVLHTNLGRAPLADQAVQWVADAARHPVNLEYDLERGERGERDELVEGDLCALTGAEAATVVNNNAAAVLLALDALAGGREVIVSRGELIEIGGSFRIPEIMAKSGAVLREVGTTNRTHARDYEGAIGPRTALLLKVHTSNYRIVGFASEVALEELVALARTRQIPVMEDLGSGALVDLGRWSLPAEPVVADRIRKGADIVTFSGDKLLGGPQCGVAVGRRDLIAQLKHDPLRRALRCDKLTLAALAATLQLYRRAPDLSLSLPTLRALTRSLAEIETVATSARDLLQAALGAGYRVELLDSQSEIGSGSVPTQTLPTKAVAVSHPTIGPHRIAERFRRARLPIVGRVHDDRFLLDARCIEDPEDLVPKE
jgi:L-seryl-tRNA(Ser) seleniumtransferase